MAEAPKAPGKPAEVTGDRDRHPLSTLRHEIDRLFDSFPLGMWRRPPVGLFDLEPFGRGELAFGKSPAVDVAEKENAYEITAELPGMEERNVDVNLANGVLTIKGEKQEEKEEREKDYHLSERRFGSFQRAFTVPDDVDADKIEASFKNDVLTVILPKAAEAQRKAKRIDIKSG